jgi:hypothetical protein
MSNYRVSRHFSLLGHIARGTIGFINPITGKDTPLPGGEAGVIASQSGMPVILPSSGTIGNNGALSGITAMGAAYPACYMYFPAGAIAAGSAAGLYYVEMASTSTGTIYNNTYASGVPAIPKVKVPFATVGPGAYVQTTNEVTLRQMTIPGGSLGPNGRLREFSLMEVNNTVGIKTLRAYFDTLLHGNIAPTTTISLRQEFFVQNAGSEQAQRYAVGTSGVAATSGSQSAASLLLGAIDTTVDKPLTITGQLSSAADYLISMAFSVETLYAE